MPTHPVLKLDSPLDLPGKTYHLPEEKRLAGNPPQTLWMQYTDPSGQFFAGHWRSEPGRWRIAYTEEEFCQMLEGVSVMTATAGQAVTLRAGDSCVVPRGFAGTWEVVETTTKRFVIYEAAAGALAMVLPAWAGNTFERNGLALRGHDPVAYFTDGQPMLGSKAFSAVHAGATYVFTSAAHRDRFVAQPERYLPQFGGFCAFGVAGGYKAAIDPAAFSIVEGKLYLNYSPKVQERWRADMSGFIQRAERQWPQVEKTEKVFE